MKKLLFEQRVMKINQKIAFKFTKGKKAMIDAIAFLTITALMPKIIFAGKFLSWLVGQKPWCPLSGLASVPVHEAILHATHRY